MLFLILAFAQPFFINEKSKGIGNKLQIIYIDNSYSMSVKKGTQTLFDIIRETAANQIKNSIPGSKFIILTNDKPKNYYPIPADQAYREVYSTELSSVSKTISDILAVVQSMRIELQNTDGVNMYYYSDFQKSAFPDVPAPSLLQQTTIYNLPIQSDEINDIFIDTAFLTTPVLQTSKSNKLIVKSSFIGKQINENTVLQLKINGQIRSATSLSFNEQHESTDTLNFSVNDASWNKIELSVNDASIKYDDTFRITARSAVNMSVLVLYEGQPNPYFQAAFRSYEGFRLNQVNVNSAPPNWKDYNLIIFAGITSINKELGKQINNALLMGQSICIFPGRTHNIQFLNEGLNQIGDIEVSSIDTIVQTTSSIQQGSSLVKELFEKIPDNVQLPVTNWHYIIHAGVSANQQSVFSFRNGDPFLACYTPTKGKLYFCSSSADLASGNFTGSYFFAPFLYQMAMQSGISSIFSLSAGQQQPIYIPLHGATERNTIHVVGSNFDIIPPQRPVGIGIDVFIDDVVQQSGFYNLVAEGFDTTTVALNLNKNESKLEYRDIKVLKNEWQGGNIKWVNINNGSNFNENSNPNKFPLWKICLMIALLMLAAETVLLSKPQLNSA